MVKQSTKILSNSEEIIKRVSQRCNGQHRHVQMIGGKAKHAQVYPKAFCQAVCEGLAAQKKIGDLGLCAQPILSMEEMAKVAKLLVVLQRLQMLVAAAATALVAVAAACLQA